MYRKPVATICFAALGLVGVVSSACWEGNFDQRVRVDIEEIRGRAFDGVNSNPASGFGKVIGVATTAGPVRAGRVSLYPVSPTGTIQDGDEDTLGNGMSSVVSGEFSATLRRAYRGPVIVSVRRTELGGTPTSYADAARASTTPNAAFGDDDELLGYVLDFPNASDAVVVSPLTTLAVERAIWLGGISSGNLSIAARQVGGFFGMTSARETVPDDLRERSASSQGANMAQNLALAAISQLALDAHVASGNVWHALRLDIRDDGELNGSIGYIPGSAVRLSNLGAADYIGSVLLEEEYLAIHNAENLSGYDLRKATEGSKLRETLDFLNGARALADVTLAIAESTLVRPVLRLKPGERASLGVRAFDHQGSGYCLVFASDGPSVLDVSAISNDLTVATIVDEFWVSVPEAAEIGSVATVTVRVRPDGVIVQGDYDRSWQLTIEVVK